MTDLDQLGSRLREAGREELEGLLDQHISEVGPSQAMQALANPFIDRDGILRLLDQRRLLSDSGLREALIRHPRTPRVLALGMVSSLYWRQLVKLGRDTRVHPTLRRAADNAIRGRLPGLSAGERVAIARQAGGGLLRILAADPDGRVVGALLDNPRLSERDLAPALVEGRSRPEVLARVAAHPRWTSRPSVRRALCLNSRTPTATVLALLPTLSKIDLGAVKSSSHLSSRVRQRAALLLGTTI
ncbi:MAG TPA: hypothetical protein VKA53_07325 [Thermoanaerobaculia bacterium]|nr:hypothetical protein [Thermoanaerobaculia bacterium]